MQSDERRRTGQRRSYCSRWVAQGKEAPGAWQLPVAGARRLPGRPEERIGFQAEPDDRGADDTDDDEQRHREWTSERRHLAVGVSGQVTDSSAGAPGTPPILAAPAADA